MQRAVRTFMALAALLPLPVLAGEVGDGLAQRLYDGTLVQVQDETYAACDAGETDACFAAGMTELVTAVETFAQELYRYGATTPGTPAAAMLFGMGVMDQGGEGAPANPHPEPLTYEALRVMLDSFVSGLDRARGRFETAGGSGDYVLMIDPLRVRIDFNGDGSIGEAETLAAIIEPLGPWGEPQQDQPQGTGKSKQKSNPSTPTAAAAIGFDRADAWWFAGYTQVVAAPIDLLLAHDFSQFYAAYMHRIFPQAGLPMEEYSRGGTLFMDAESDTFIADIIAAIHTLRFPVSDGERLAGVLDRLTAIPELSRRNWDAILAETDDNRELVPSPRQTSLLPDAEVTEATVAAWMATLDTVDQILAGDLLVPHWRFVRGFDLAAYFNTAAETDVVMILTGQGALPFLKDGPVADGQSFAEANRVFGTDWINYVFWFN